MKRDMREYDGLIILTPGDYQRVESQYQRVVELLPVRKLFFVGSKKLGELVKQSGFGERVGFLDEESILPFEEVHRVMKKALGKGEEEDLPRGITGWYYQQFLKMKYAQMCRDEYYLVWDGDTVPCKSFRMFGEASETPYLDLKTEYHEEYFITLGKLFPGMRKCIQKSFIAEHMLFHCGIMRELIEEIERNDSILGTSFWEKILWAIEPEKRMSNSFSEFETYGTYTALRHMDAYRLRDWHSFRYGGEFFEISQIGEEDFQWLAKDFYAISFEKGHSVREDHKNLFSNREYQKKLSARKMLEISQQEFGEGSYQESWEDDLLTEDEKAVKEANRYFESGETAEMFRAIREGLLQNITNYELYYLLGFYYAQTNPDQAYLCFENALFYCRQEEDRAVIGRSMDELKEMGSLTVRPTAIVIATYNNSYLLQKNIESIRATLPQGSYQVIVVDNASDDETAQWLDAQEDLLVLHNAQNEGFSKACNKGAEMTHAAGYGDYDIYLLNDDTRLAANTLFWLRMGLYEQEDVGAVGSLANYAGNEQQLEVEFPLPGQYLDYAKKINVPEEYPYEERVRLSGFSMLIRREVWDLTGGLDEAFSPGYFEDDDLSVRIQMEGYRLCICKNSFLYHAGSQSFVKRPDLEQLLSEHHQLFCQKHGFDILEVAAPNRELIAGIPYAETEEFNVLQIGSGIGADLKYIRALFPRANAVGIEPDEKRYRVAAGTNIVSPGIEELAKEIAQPIFQVLLLPGEGYGQLSAQEMQCIENMCLPGCLVLPKSRERATLEPEKIKLIIWDLDQTFWRGILSEGTVSPIGENVELLKTLTDCGVIHSVSSKNDSRQAMQVLKDWGLDAYFVFADINWQNKGEQIQRKLEDMHLRAENVLFLDDDPHNLEEAKYYNPGIMTALPEKIPELIEYARKAKKTDPEHKRLEQYRVMEQRRMAQQECSSKERFLQESGITVEVCGDCRGALDRIAELIARTNQLNYTKVRDDREQLELLCADETIEKGYIRAWDKFGDYGIVGFYCYEPGAPMLRHFLFSCRVIGLGIDQWVYRFLNAPQLQAVQPIAGKLDAKTEIPWIRQAPEKQEGDVRGDAAQEAQSGKDNRIKVLLKGPCDMDSIAVYLSGGAVDTEFNFVNDRGFITTGQNHSMHIWESEHLSPQEIAEILQEAPFLTQEDFQTNLFRKEYHVICYSLLPDCHAGLYRNRKTGTYISFGSRNFDLTEPKNWPGYLDGSIVNHAFPFTEEILKRFAQEWEFVGATPQEELLRNLDDIYTHVPGEPTIILLLGSEVEYEGENEEFAGHAKVHQEVNRLVKAFAADKERIKVIETTDYIHSQTDYEDCINHFSRNVYYDLASAVCAQINEKVAQLKARKDVC